MTADGTSIPIASVDSIDTHYFSLHDIYHIRGLTLNLIFDNQLCESRYFIFSFSFTYYVQDTQRQKLI